MRSKCFGGCPSSAFRSSHPPHHHIIISSHLANRRPVAHSNQHTAQETLSLGCTMSALDQPHQEFQGCFGFCTDTEPSYFDFLRKNQGNEDVLSNHDQQKKQEIDDMLSDALNNLTFEERQEQQEVLHGVNDKIRDEAAFIEQSLHDLDDFLNRAKGGSVYEIAESMNAGYVSARAFRIMFLRGNRYDAKAAANQMIRFFAQKEKIFGTEKLVKDITIEDLDEDDLAFLKSGCIQLGGNTKSNRQAIFQFPGIRHFKTLQNELRTRYFITMCALESEEVQLNGAVVVTYTVGEYRDNKEGGGYLDNMRLAMVRCIVLLSCAPKSMDVTHDSVECSRFPFSLHPI